MKRTRPKNSIKQNRLRMGLTHAQLAKKIGVDRSMIYQYEDKKNPSVPGPKIAAKLCKVFGISIGNLLYY